MAPGMRRPLTARHDTYGISFSRGTPGATAAQDSGADDENTEQHADANGFELPAALPTGVPLQVPCPAAQCRWNQQHKNATLLLWHYAEFLHIMRSHAPD